MYIYEPLLLANSCVDALAAIVFLAVGIWTIRRPKISEWFRGPLFISMALIQAVQSAAMFSHALHWHHPSVRTLMLGEFSGGMIVVTVLSAGLNMYIVRRLHYWSEKTEVRGPVEITRVA